jgi:hypothetical protein
LWRYKSNPIIVAGEKIKEPLIHLIKSDDDGAVGRRRRSKNGPRKRNNQGSGNSNSENSSSKAKVSDTSKDNTGGFGAFGNSDSVDSTTGTVEGKVCPECDCEEVQRLGNSKLRCRVCRHSWR